jgi:hypothetical protein
MRWVAIVLISALAMLGGCSGTPKPPAEALRLSAESLRDRQLQMRRYETDDEEKMLAASAALLQDLGFNLDESETRLGVISASKSRDARETGQMVGSFFVAVLTGVAMPTDRVQKIFASVVTRPAGEKSMVVRVRGLDRVISGSPPGRLTSTACRKTPDNISVR